MKRGDLDDTSRRLKDLQGTLTVMRDFTNSHYLKFIADKVDCDRVHPSSCLKRHTKKIFVPPESTPHTGRLHCSNDCACRCHDSSVTSLLPRCLTTYFGQIFISKRLLHPTFSSWSRCNLATCRGDFLEPCKICFVLPPGYLYGCLRSSPNSHIHFYIGAPRVVSWDSDILRAVWFSDVQEVRGLFTKHQASIWDFDPDGDSVFWHVCSKWQREPTEERLEIVRFFLEAGADALFFAETKATYSAHDTLVLGLFQYLLTGLDPARSLAAAVRTNPIAIDIFLPLFNIDPMDAMEDFLTRRPQCKANVTHLLASISSTRSSSTARISLFQAIGYTPLEYAIAFSPASVEYILADGPDSAIKHALSRAVKNGRKNLIGPLIAAGADVNMTDSKGLTALHWACHWFDYHSFLELLRCAEDDIDWNARTLDGKDALDLLQLSVAEGKASHLSLSQVDHIRSAVLSHMDDTEYQLDGNELFRMPGAFPVEC
ncbi:ankyrin repeat-containing domain protein [Irpex lacteus]|nr:ankyrin repeat-containing domain protein [Irpex lacteus]